MTRTAFSEVPLTDSTMLSFDGSVLEQSGPEGFGDLM